jgi:hypothetical protein
MGAWDWGSSLCYNFVAHTAVGFVGWSTAGEGVRLMDLVTGGFLLENGWFFAVSLFCYDTWLWKIGLLLLYTVLFFLH